MAVSRIAELCSLFPEEEVFLLVQEKQAAQPRLLRYGSVAVIAPTYDIDLLLGSLNACIVVWELLLFVHIQTTGQSCFLIKLKNVILPFLLRNEDLLVGFPDLEFRLNSRNSYVVHPLVDDLESQEFVIWQVAEDGTCSPVGLDNF